jgi:hypothetical protein
MGSGESILQTRRMITELSLNDYFHSYLFCLWTFHRFDSSIYPAKILKFSNYLTQYNEYVYHKYFENFYWISALMYLH